MPQVLWRDGDLGYAIVSDVSARELSAVAGELAAATMRQRSSAPAAPRSPRGDAERVSRDDGSPDDSAS